MSKRLIMIMVSVSLAAVVGFGGFGVWYASAQTPKFQQAGYILQGEEDEVKWHSFDSGEKYVSTLTGDINFDSTEEGEVTVSEESFVHFEDGSMMALSDGILLDFNDLSENFINNYYIEAGLKILPSGDTYTAETTAGSMSFGEHLWKLSEKKYLIAAKEIKVYMSGSDIREVQDYIQVVMTEDNVAHLLTQENLWMTISKECYIETQSGVKIYPMTGLIDNGKNKLSMAKLSVSPEDAIVLTEDETRRQIVPELNIEAIDGKDGTDGEDGQIGRDGEAGEIGKDGEDGQIGKDGTDGQNGEQGETGAAGVTGAAGASGTSGASGASGAAGTGGGNGAKGADGKNAVIDSTTNSALPTMTISDWQVSATSLKGTIAINDEGGFLSALKEVEGYSEDRYPGSVNITNVQTGEIIHCYQTMSEDYSLTNVNKDNYSFDFNEGAEEVYFSTYDSDGYKLAPDTEYSLSVTAYYKATDDTGLIYSREFISRTFYTDSTGVALAKEKANTNSLTISATVSETYQDSVVQATVYLLTPEQNKTFTAALAEDTTRYVTRESIDRDSFDGAGWSKSIDFTELSPSTEYVARVIVETTAGLRTLTTQELSAKTLKRPPTLKTEGDVPKVYYNRASGAFEVYRPAIQDSDGGAVSYIYTAYKLNDIDASTWEKESARTITPATGEPVEFHLQSGKTYKFGIELEFDDNDKKVRYDFGESAPIAAIGDTMPKVTLEPGTNGIDYNKYNGTIKISLQSSSSITVDNTHPLKLEFYADQIWSESVELTGGTPTTLTDRYTIAYEENSSDTNNKSISLALDNLYKNTNYSITVSGYLDLGDGNGAVNRAIGTVSFRTYNTMNLGATWTVPSTVSTAFARVLKLSVQDSAATDVRTSYAMDELQEGQVTVELYSGTGTGKLRIAQKNFNEAEDLGALFTGSGLTITEESFGGPALNREANYTLTVTSVADGSYGRNLGYVNTFDSIQNASEVVSAEPVPPDLLTDSSKGISAAPIYNEQATTYGATVDESLPDDAIIGYTLESTYDNVERIGKTITYYAYEFNTYYNTLKAGKDPIKEATPLMKMTRSIDSGSDTVPKVAVLFGGTKTDDDSSQIHNGYQVYHAGAANLTGTQLSSGMDRGYRYIFAYTVKYAGSSTGESESEKTYPYDHKSYADYNKYYGGITVMNVNLGKEVAYVLNSGMCEAPKIMPDFHTYVYNQTQGPLASSSAATASGSVTLHYTWRDPDGLIKTGLTDDVNTKLTWNVAGSSGTQNTKINDKVVDGKWYEVSIPYTISRNAKDVVTPTVNISGYLLDYNTALRALGISEDEGEYPVASIPVEWSWGKQLTRDEYKDKVMIEVEQNLDANNINFYLVSDVGNNEAREALVSRAVAMKLTVKTTDSDAQTKTFVLPLKELAGRAYAQLATGLLGTEFLGKEFNVEATLLYDTGIQGWKILEDETEAGNGFALQYTNSQAVSGEDSIFGFDSYIGSASSATIPANGGLYSRVGSGTFSALGLRNTINGEDPDKDTKYTLTIRNNVSVGDSSRYLYPDRMGVDSHNSNNAENLSGRYIVPKQIAEYELGFSEQDAGKITLTTITPTMIKPNFSISSSTVEPRDYTVAGFTGEGTIYMAAYLTRDDAEKLNTQIAGSEVAITVGADGKPETKSIQGLTAGNQYYIAFYYKNSERRNVLLLRSDSVDSAIFEVTTSTNAVINITNNEYLNLGYFDKLLKVDFSISRIFNVKLSYDIYASEADAESGTDPLLTDAQLGTGNENNILTKPEVVTYADNHLRFNLKPSEARKSLVPGVTYYLRITASEPDASGTSATEVGHKVEPFTLTSVGSVGALIYVQSANDSSITFRVVINDPEYALMGRETASNNEGALYAVRFTDENGNVLRTKYDNKVYNAAEAYQDFVLNNNYLINDSIETNSSIAANQKYRLNIYAVPDMNHSGEILLGGESKKWGDFFDKTKDTLAECGEKFLEVVGSFWNANTSNNTDKDAIEKQLLIAEKLQSTTLQAGWLLNENEIYAKRQTTDTVRIMFEESFGLIATTTSGEEPVFRKIDWQVEGFRSDASPLKISGQSLYSKGEKLLQKGNIADKYNTYYYDIPTTVGQGSYTIVLYLYETETAETAAEKITIRSGV